MKYSRVFRATSAFACTQNTYNRPILNVGWPIVSLTPHLLIPVTSTTAFIT